MYTVKRQLRLSENQKRVLRYVAGIEKTPALWGNGRECSNAASAFWRGFRALREHGLVSVSYDARGVGDFRATDKGLKMISEGL